MQAAPENHPPREDDCPHCRKMRKHAMRPVLYWEPDLASPYFAAESRRQARAIAESPAAEEVMAFIESISIPIDEWD